MKILILASNPYKDLKLDREIRDLRDVIEKSRNRQDFEVKDALAVRVGDLQDLLFQHEPQIVHFCGHGSGKQGLVFEDNDGGERGVEAEALSALFKLFSSQVGCVLLNACYSEVQANEIVNHIDYVIGMNQAIQDNAAIAFSKGFYRALGYKRSIEDAFEFGKNAIQLEVSGSSKMRSVATEVERKAEVVDAIQRITIPEHLKPILRQKSTQAQSLRANITAPEQPLTQEDRAAIQLVIDEALAEESDSAKQYRAKVKEYLSDDQLALYERTDIRNRAKKLNLSSEEAERILEEEKEERYRVRLKEYVADLERRQPGWEARLDVIRQAIDLSDQRAREILDMELAPIREAQESYRDLLNDLIQDGLHPPFKADVEEWLQKRQQEEKLTKEEVDEVSAPIFQKAYEQHFRSVVGATYPLSESDRGDLEKLQQELGLSDAVVEQIEQPLVAPKEAEHEEKLKRYEQKFRQAVEARYPLGEDVRNQLAALQQSLKLQAEDTTRIEQPIAAAADAKYKEQRRQEEAQIRQREYENNLQHYEQAFRSAVDAAYPLSEAVRDQLKNRQQALGLSEEEVAEIANPILAAAEEAHRQNLQRYEQEFRTAIAAQYPINNSFVRDGLNKFHESLKLSYGDVARIEESLIVLLEQQQEEQRRQEEEQRLAAEKRAYEEKLQRYRLSPFEFQISRLEIIEKSVDKQIEKSGLFGKRIETVRTTEKACKTINQQGQADYFVEDLGSDVGLEMVLIREGTFMMGSPKDEESRSLDEGPQHSVTVLPFCMGKFAVTQSQWDAVARLPKVKIDLNPDPSEFKGSKRPVEKVSWHEAVEFCDRLSQKTGRQYRLPSEAEWEYACRAGTKTPFHFGETITTDLANYAGVDLKYPNGNVYSGSYGAGPKGVYRKETTDVGSFPANSFGLCDMHGNVWEWCADYYHENYEGAPTDGSAWLTADHDAKRLLRGGSWNNNPRFCRSAFRNYFAPDDQFRILGFRVVCGLA